jgi:hypothetical protein
MAQGHISLSTLDDQEEMQLWQDLQDIGQVVEKSLWVVTHALT